MLDAPLLFESKILEFFCHPIIVVAIAEKEKQLERLMKRNDLNEDEAKNKINSQMPLDAKIAKADIVVDNSGSQDDLIKQLKKETLPKVFRELKLDSIYSIQQKD